MDVCVGIVSVSVMCGCGMRYLSVVNYERMLDGTWRLQLLGHGAGDGGETEMCFHLILQ